METLVNLEHHYAIFDELLEGCRIIDYDWRYIYMNDAAARHARTTKEAFLGRKLTDLFPHLEDSALLCLMQDCMLKRNHHHVENKHVFLDGTIGWFELRIQPVPEGIFILSLDITKRKLAELKVRENEARLALIFNHCPLGVVMTRVSDGIIIDVNEAFAKIHGYTIDEIIGKSSLELRMWANVDQREVMIKGLKEKGVVKGMEIKSRKKNGEIFDLRISTELLTLGGELFSIGIAQDITGENKIEFSVHELEKQFSVTFNASLTPQAITSIDIGEILAVNDAFCSLFDYSRDELIGHTTSKLKMWGHDEERVAVIEQLKACGFVQMLETTIRVNSGKIKTIVVSLEKILLKGQDCIISSVLDITERKALELALKLKNEEVEAQNEEYRQINEELIKAREITLEDEKKIKIQAEELESFFSSSIDLLCIADTDGHFLRLNKEWEKTLGYKVHELIGRNFLDFIYPDDLNGTLVALSQLEKQIAVSNYTNRYLCKDGSYKWLEWRSYPKGKKIYATARDISERKDFELALRESETKFRKIYEEGPYGMVLVDKQFRFISANSMFCRMLGYSETELQIKTFKDITHSDDIEDNIQHVNKLIKGEIPVYKTEKRFIRKDEQIIWGALTVTANFNNNGEFNYNIGIIEDITRRKQIDGVISKITERLELATRASGIGIWDWDILSNQLIWDQQMYKLYGFDEETFPEVYEAWLNGLHPDDRESSHQISQMAVKGEKEYDTEFRVVWPDKSVHWLKAAGQVFYDANHTPIRMVGVNYDITKQKQAENEITESKTKLETALASMTDAVFISDLDGRFIEFNDAFSTFHKFKNKDECAKTLAEYPEFLEVYMDTGELAPLDMWAVPRALRGETVINAEYSLRRKDTGETWVGSYSFAPVRDQKGSIVGSVVVGRDITEKKKHESLLKEKTEEIEAQNEEYLQINEELIQTNEELLYAKERAEESEARFRAIFENSMDAIGVTVKGIIIYTNPAYLNLFGYSNVEEIVGTSVVEQISLQERAKMVANIASRAKTSSQDRYETIGLRKDGSEFPFEICVSNYNFKSENYSVGIIRDLSDQKLAEQKQKQHNLELITAKEKAEESDRLKTAFLQNVSHEIRTPMNAIMGFSELLVKNYNDKSKLEQFSMIINQRCNDLLEIINEILDVAKIESGQLQVNAEECDIKSLLYDVYEFFTHAQKRQNKQHIEFTTQILCEESELLVLIDKVKLKQIFINLIGNAFKFTNNGKIQIGCNLDEDNNLIFYVSDTGIGIPDDKKDYIFERFAQLESATDRLYGGTGLGLSIVKGLIGMLGGNIWVESEVGKGSTFYFSLPHNTVKYQPSSRPDINRTKDEAYSFYGKTILIVEDDFYNADYLKELFEDTGVKVIISYSGQQALEMFQSQNIDVVLMDIRLPDTDGYELTRAIKHIRPEIAIIAQTAYASLDDREKAINSGCNDYVSKPIKPDEILQMVHNHLHV